MTTRVSLIFPYRSPVALLQALSLGTESSSSGHWNSSSKACSQSLWAEQVISAIDFQQVDRNTFGTFYWDFVQEGKARCGLLLRYRLLFEVPHQFQCPDVLWPSSSWAATWRSRTSLFFVTALFTKIWISKLAKEDLIPAINKTKKAPWLRRHFSCMLRAPPQLGQHASIWWT